MQEHARTQTNPVTAKTIERVNTLPFAAQQREYQQAFLDRQTGNPFQHFLPTRHALLPMHFRYPLALPAQPVSQTVNVSGQLGQCLAVAFRQRLLLHHVKRLQQLVTQGNQGGEGFKAATGIRPCCLFPSCHIGSQGIGEVFIREHIHIILTAATFGRVESMFSAFFAQVIE